VELDRAAVAAEDAFALRNLAWILRDRRNVFGERDAIDCRFRRFVGGAARLLDGPVTSTSSEDGSTMIFPDVVDLDAAPLAIG
jgi:hypothetical protein